MAWWRSCARASLLPNSCVSFTNIRFLLIAAAQQKNTWQKTKFAFLYELFYRPLEKLVWKQTNWINRSSGDNATCSSALHGPANISHYKLLICTFGSMLECDYVERNTVWSMALAMAVVDDWIVISLKFISWIVMRRYWNSMIYFVLTEDSSIRLDQPVSSPTYANICIRNRST